MNLIRMILLLWKRNFKNFLSSALVTLFIFSLVGVMITSSSIMFTSTLRDELNNAGFYQSASIGQDGMEGLSFEEITNTFSSIRTEGLDINYCILINVIYNFQGKDFLVPLIGLDQDLINYAGFSQNDIIAAIEFEKNSVNISKAIPYYDEDKTHESYVYSLNFTQQIYTTNNTIINYFLSKVKNSYFQKFYTAIGTKTNYYESNYFILCNMSMISYLSEYFSVESKELGAIIVENIHKNAFRTISVDKIRTDIQNHEKLVFQKLVENGFNAEYIYFDSVTEQILQKCEVYTSYEVYTIQRLGSINIIIVVLLLSTLELGVYQFIKNQGELLKTKGLSAKKIFLLFFVVDLLIDSLAVIFSLIVFSLICLMLNLPSTTIIYIAITYGLFFVVVTLSKIINLLVFTKKQLQHKKVKTKRSRRIAIQRNVVLLSTVFLVTIMQMYRVLDPLFYFKILDRNTILLTNSNQIIIDILSIALISVEVFIYISVNMESKKPKKKKTIQLSVKKLLNRLVSKDLKIFRLQQLIIICLYTLLFYLIVFKVIQEPRIELYENNGSWDFTISNIDGFSYEKVANLSQLIPQIREWCPFAYNWGEIISDSSTYFYSNIYTINTTAYLANDLAWEHFIGSETYKFNNTILKEVKGKSIIINKALAEKSSLKEGDKITLEIVFDDFGYDKSVKIENLTVFGIVDTLDRYVSTHNEITIDISLFLDICKKANVEPRITRFAVNFSFSENATEEEKLTAKEHYISRIYEELDISNNVFSHSYNTEIDKLKEKNISETFFIYGEILLCMVFVPGTIMVLSRSAIDKIAPDLVKIGTRGYSDKNIRKEYGRKVYSLLITSILLGLYMGLIIGTVYANKQLPSVYFAKNATKLYAKIGLYFLLCAIGGILSTVAFLQFSIKKISTVMKEKRRWILKNETHRN